MLVAHLTSSTFFGGPERQMLELARALPDEWRTIFLSFAEVSRCREFLERVRDEGFHGVELQHDTPRVCSAVRELTRQLLDERVNILLCHGYKADLVGFWAARRAGIPVLAVSRGWTGESRRVRLYEAIDRQVLRWLDRVVCVSAAQAAKVRQAGVAPEKVVVIANAIRASRFRAAAPAARAELERWLGGRCRRIVAAAGRLSPEKGFQVLVEAAGQINDPSTGFIMFGDGVLRETMQRRIDQLGLQSRFVLAGYRRDLDELIPAADLMVLPSFTEGMPNVVLESLAAGVPVVATAVGGTPEVLDESCGRLVPPGNPSALASGIVDVLADETRRQQLGRTGQERVRRCFTFTAQAEQYVRLFDSLVSDGLPVTGAWPARRALRTEICNK